MLYQKETLTNLKRNTTTKPSVIFPLITSVKPYHVFLCLALITTPVECCLTFANLLQSDERYYGLQL